MSDVDTTRMSKRELLKYLDELTVEVIIEKMKGKNTINEDGKREHEPPSDFIIGQAISYLTKNNIASDKEKKVDDVAVEKRREAKARREANAHKAKRKADNDEV